MNRGAGLIFSDCPDSFYGRRCRYFRSGNDPPRFLIMEISKTSGSCDYESGGGFDCSLILLIRFMAADVGIFHVGAMPGDGRQEA